MKMSEKETEYNAAIEDAAQAIRYLLKHQSLNARSEYGQGFTIACELAEQKVLRLKETAKLKPRRSPPE
jgi:hypothetical protein